MSRIYRGVLAAVAAVGLLVIAPVNPVAVVLTATALYMGGTGHTLTIPGPNPPSYIEQYVNWAYDNYVGPSQLCGPSCTPAAVYTPAEFWPNTGLRSMTFDESVAIGLANLNDCLRGAPCAVTDPPFTSSTSRVVTDSSFTVFGYSDSATIASLQKSDLIAHPPDETVSFVLLSSGNRPNGGILERFVGVRLPILGVTFGGATVTNSPQPTPLTTVDVAHQYDLMADFPTNPLNLLADFNAVLGSWFDHPEFGTGTALLQGQYQDTTYYLYPSDPLPLVRPLTVLPWIGPTLAVLLDPPLRVLVEAGYNRTINPGSPTPAQWLYVPNPITTTLHFLHAIPTGWDNAIAEITGDPANRPFHTAAPGPFGVGGPPVYAGAVDPYGPPTPLLSSAELRRQSASSGLRESSLGAVDQGGAVDGAEPQRRVLNRSLTKPVVVGPVVHLDGPRAAGALLREKFDRALDVAGAEVQHRPGV